MRDISAQIKKLLDKYGSDARAALRENPDLEYLYALSGQREGILEWYEFESGASLLQVGSDYGALTGMLSAKVDKVTVLDPSPENLEVARLRWGCGKISYREGDLLTFDAGESFDYVVMIGSLEPPFEDRIERAKSLLKSDGKLIVAVCNRFGMKYWAGAQPDPCSFSRREITDLLLSGGGEGSLEFYYPMPDYRLPSAVYSESYLPGPGEMAGQAIAYDYPRYLKFNVGEKLDEVSLDGQFEYFANSFLAIWSSHEKD